MSRVTQNTTHITDALGRVIQQYSKAANLQNIITAFVEQIQNLEDSLFTVYGRLDIDNSKGAQLDGIGVIVDIARQGFDDDTYRILLKGKIATNISDGTPEKIISAYNILTSGSESHLIEIFPAQIAIINTGTIVSGLESLVLTMVQNATAAGVGVDYIGHHEGVAGFGFENSNGLGFGKMLEQGSNTSVSSGKLLDSGATFQANGVLPADTVYNNSDSSPGSVISARVLGVDSEIQLTIDTDIFTGTGKEYYVNSGSIGGKFAFIFV